MLLLAITRLFFILTAATAGSTITYEGCVPPCASMAQLERDVGITVFNGTLDESVSVISANAAEAMRYINPALKTVVLMYGWTGYTGTSRTAIDASCNAYLAEKTWNVIRVDWDRIARDLFYPRVAASVKGVGFFLASILEVLISLGLDRSTLWLVGHSLGAHSLGWVGRFAVEEMPRITGLDPAGPDFYRPSDGLNTDCAKFVIVVHSDSGGLGTLYLLGHVDVFVNGGHAVQPSCQFPLLDPGCSHALSFLLWSATVRRPELFLAIACGSPLSCAPDFCNSNEIVPMGDSTPPTTRGTFYIKTTGKADYGLGESGATCKGPPLLTSILSLIL